MFALGGLSYPPPARGRWRHRAEAERWRQTFTLYFGEVHGAPTPGWLGLHPGQ
jgi:hypothetical protein